RNPLADPYLLGAAAGANLGATLAIAFAPGISVLSVNIVPLAAFVGAGAAVAGAYALGRSVTGLRSTVGLILAGVAIAAFFNSIQSYVQQTQTSSIRQVYSWILGRLVTAGWDDVILVLPYVVLSVAVIFLHRRLLDSLTLGEDEITSLGIPVRRVRLIVVVAATLGTAAVVAVGGTIARLVPFRGEIQIGGRAVTALSQRQAARNVAMLVQEPQMPAGMTVSQYVLLGRAPHLGYLGRESSRDRRIVRDIVRRLALEDMTSRPLD